MDTHDQNLNMASEQKSQQTVWQIKMKILTTRSSVQRSRIRREKLIIRVILGDRLNSSTSSESSQKERDRCTCVCDYICVHTCVKVWL